MSGEIDSRKDSHEHVLKNSNKDLVKLSFSEFYDSKIFGLNPFNNTAIIH